MVSVGIVDLGRARTKASVWTLDGDRKRVWSATANTGSHVGNGDLEALSAAIRDLVSEVRRHADVVLACGGSLLRDSKWHLLADLVPDLVDRFFTLSEHEEASLLLMAAVGSQDERGHVFADIGGGSVQLVRSGGQGVETLSWPLGTYKIQGRFGLTVGQPIETYEAAAAKICHELHAGGLTWRSRRLSLGSNVMGSFMDALSSRLPGEPAPGWSVKDLDAAWRYCAMVPRADFDEIFPQLPDFMNGADKAMLLGWILADMIGADIITGSDASISEGLAVAYGVAKAGGLSYLDIVLS